MFLVHQYTNTGSTYEGCVSKVNTSSSTEICQQLGHEPEKSKLWRMSKDLNGKRQFHRVKFDRSWSHIILSKSYVLDLKNV